MHADLPTKLFKAGSIFFFTFGDSQLTAESRCAARSSICSKAPEQTGEHLRILRGLFSESETNALGLSYRPRITSLPHLTPVPGRSEPYAQTIASLLRCVKLRKRYATEVQKFRAWPKSSRSARAPCSGGLSSTVWISKIFWTTPAGSL